MAGVGAETGAGVVAAVVLEEAAGVEGAGLGYKIKGLYLSSGTVYCTVS